MENKEHIEFLDWIVQCDFQHYITKNHPQIESTGKSHWFIAGSPERFTSEELLQIWQETADANLKERWKWAKADKKEDY